MKVNVTFEQSGGSFEVRLSYASESFAPDFGSVETVTDYGNVESYTGSYEVTPRVSAQMLETANKLMQKDVAIRAIPYYDVSNTAGGNTIFIGNEV